MSLTFLNNIVDIFSMSWYVFFKFAIVAIQSVRVTSLAKKEWRFLNIEKLGSTCCMQGIWLSSPWATEQKYLLNSLVIYWWSEQISLFILIGFTLCVFEEVLRPISVFIPFHDFFILELHFLKNSWKYFLLELRITFWSTFL